MQKKKILLVSKLPPPWYGTTVWTNILINSSLGRYYDFTHFNCSINKDLSTLGRFSISKVFLHFKIYMKLGNVLKLQEPDLVYIPVSQSTLGFVKDSFFILQCRIHKRKILLTLHGSNFRNWISGSFWLTQNYVRRCLKFAYGIVVLGDNIKSVFADYFPPSRIFSVPNGANFMFPQKKFSSVVRILYLGNLQPSKGIEDILSSLKLIECEKCNYRLDVVGAWRSENTASLCRNFVTVNELPVYFHEPVYGEKKYEFLADADIFIFTPRSPEGHPFVIIEAMAAGLPIISTDKGAITESVHDGLNGFIVKTHNPMEIASRITFLLRNKEKRVQMGKESRRIYEEKFTEEKMVENLRTVFDYVLSN